MSNLMSTAGGLLVLMLGVLPGLPGEVVYSQLVGTSWREKDRTFYLRIISFSVVGAAAYALVAQHAGGPPPLHLIPASFLDSSLGTTTLAAIAAGYLGHVASAGMIGALAAGGQRFLRRVFPHAVRHADAWDEFVRIYAPGRWVVVSLEGGESYAGQLVQADIAVESEWRDLVLEEPARYEAEVKNYRATSSQYLFLRGAEVLSIAASATPEDGARVTEIGTLVFPEENVDA